MCNGGRAEGMKVAGGQWEVGMVGRKWEARQWAAARQWVGRWCVKRAREGVRVQGVRGSANGRRVRALR